MVESVVNQVGVDVNTASPALLTYVSGIGQKLAERVVAFRDANGPFRSREQLKKVSGLGPKAYEQSAGFMRIRGGVNRMADLLNVSRATIYNYRSSLKNDDT